MRYVENDLVLLRRFTDKGDQEAFGEIVRRYAGMVFSVCRRILGDRARAEEVSQETFFRLMTRPQSVTQSLGGWLHRAATRLAVDERRSETSRRRREWDVAHDAQETDREPAREARWSEISPHIDEAMARLPERSRVLLIKHFLEGRQQQELARDANVSAATISRRIKLAADELRRELRRRGVDVMPSALLLLWAQQAIEIVPQSLVHELAKMSMISGVKVAAHRSLHLVGQHAATGLRASIEARWAVAAFLLSALIIAAMETEFHFHWLDRMIPSLVNHNVTANDVLQGARGDTSPAVSIPGPADMDSARIARFQRAGSGRYATVTLVYGDNHTVVMPPTEARRAIQRQTGKSPEQLAIEQSTRDLSGPTH